MNSDRSGLDFQVTPTDAASKAGLSEYLSLVRSYASQRFPRGLRFKKSMSRLSRRLLFAEGAT